MLTTVLVLGHGKPPAFDVTASPGPFGAIAAVDIGDLRIQSSDRHELRRLALALLHASELLEPAVVTT